MDAYTSLASYISYIISCIIIPKRNKLNRQGNLLRKQSKLIHDRYQRHASLVNCPQDHLSDKTIIFNVEEALLKSSSLFPYFMLVAFEAGNPLRALILLALYPLICIVGKNMGLKIMVMVCFFGLKKESCYRMGRAVMPKALLDDVGVEGFDVVNKCKRKIGVSNMPKVMLESFLRDYLEIDLVLGREIKDFHGYCIGLLEENEDVINLEKILREEEMASSNVIGACGPGDSLIHPWFSNCKETYITSVGERKQWQTLPRDKYPKPLIFHDGRLVTKPTPQMAIALFMWLPFSLFLVIMRLIPCIALPFKTVRPILAFLGMRLVVSESKPTNPSSPRREKPHERRRGILYVCNHRTLCEPFYLKLGLEKDVVALSYGLSKIINFLSLSVTLTRKREEDAMIIRKFLDQGHNLSICPEGTTCREPYLLRFSPLFTEVSDYLVPVAINSCFTMFYGNTAAGLKFFDPVFFLMDPHPSYTVSLLEKVRGLSARQDDNGLSKFDLANQVQREIAEVLGLECTRLTRKDNTLSLKNNNYNLLKLARKEQCLALGTRLRSKYKIKYQFYRVFPNGDVQYLHLKDGVYPEKVNAGRDGVGQNFRSIGKNVSPIEVKFTGKQVYDI
ncbi:putative glycerol-3-phosphate acyltransferase 3 [Drosera capensis]